MPTHLSVTFGNVKFLPQWPCNPTLVLMLCDVHPPFRDFKALGSVVVNTLCQFLKQYHMVNIGQTGCSQEVRRCALLLLVLLLGVLLQAAASAVATACSSCSTASTTPLQRVQV
jgi:hypothetical protein